MELLDWLKILLIGIVEGITEWLPISSTGHMILVDQWIGLKMTPAFKELFLTVIQLGAILAVVVLYFRRLNPFERHKTAVERREIWTLWMKVVVACIPGGVMSVLFDDYIDAHFFNHLTVATTLIVYGVLYILVERAHRGRDGRIRSFADLDFRSALLIGCFQVLALIPGTSRSGATIIGAILIGTSRVIAAEFTFFLAIPVMFGQSLLKLVKFGFGFTAIEAAMLLTGMAVAFVVSILTIRFLLAYIRRNDFTVFGWYRIALGAVVIGAFLLNR